MFTWDAKLDESVRCTHLTLQPPGKFIQDKQEPKADSTCIVASY